mmetsp:Transcript_29658/g.38240  ORF Transcript_29658/g.38240 Transcript_29658/m.38240 type:complete len:441 (+) Transcript_29658:209-1531(+)
MEGVQVLSLIEKRTGVALPTGIMFEEETTLQRLVPLIKKGGIIASRACVVDLAHLSRIDLPKQSEGERLTKANKCTIKSSWRGEDFPPNTLSSLPKPTKEMPHDMNLKIGEMFVSVLIARSTHEAGFCFFISLCLCLSRILTTDVATDSFIIIRSFLWVLMLTISLLWLLSCLLSMKLLAKDYLNEPPQMVQNNNKNSKIRASSIQAQICSFFGAKLLYEEKLKFQDGPYFILAFAPAAYLKNTSKNNNERSEARDEYNNMINKQLDKMGGLYSQTSFLKQFNDQTQHQNKVDKTDHKEMKSIVSEFSLPFVTPLHETIGSFALTIAASMHSTVFGGQHCFYNEDTEVNKSPVLKCPTICLHGLGEVEELASSSSTSSTAIPLSLAAFNSPLQLNGFSNVLDTRMNEIKSIFKKNGSIFYTAGVPSLSENMMTKQMSTKE